MLGVKVCIPTLNFLFLIFIFSDRVLLCLSDEGELTASFMPISGGSGKEMMGSAWELYVAMATRDIRMCKSHSTFVKWPILCPLDCSSSSWRSCPSSCTCPTQQRMTLSSGPPSGGAAPWDTSPRPRSISLLSPAVTSCLRSSRSAMGWPSASPQPVSSGSLGAWPLCGQWVWRGVTPAPTHVYRQAPSKL